MQVKNKCIIVQIDGEENKLIEAHKEQLYQFV